MKNLNESHFKYIPIPPHPLQRPTSNSSVDFFPEYYLLLCDHQSQHCHGIAGGQHSVPLVTDKPGGDDLFHHGTNFYLKSYINENRNKNQDRLYEAICCGMSCHKLIYDMIVS